MKRLRLRNGLTWIVLFLLGAGCSSRSDEQALLRTALLRQSADSKAISLLWEGRQRFQQGRFPDALVLVDSAVRYAPELADIQYLRGLTLLELNDMVQARAAFEQVLALDPYYPGARAQLGNLAFLRYRYQQALEQYRAEEELLIKIQRAGAVYPYIEPKALPAIRLQIGRACIHLGEVDCARRAFHQAIAADSLFAKAYSELSRLYEEEGEEKALTFARRAFELDPEDAEVQYVLGTLLLRMGQPEEAYEYLRNVLAEHPSHAGALFNFGQVLLRIGQLKKAEYYLEKADRMQELQQQIAQVQINLRQRSDDPAHWIELSDLLLQSGQRDQAKRALYVAIRLHPGSPELQEKINRLAQAVSREQQDRVSPGDAAVPE